MVDQTKTVTGALSEIAQNLEALGGGVPQATQKSKTVTGALSEIAQSLKVLGGGVPQATQSGPHEEVIIRYTVGTGRFTTDGKYIILTSKMYKLNGEEDGHHEGVFETRSPDVAALLKWFDPPKPPLDAPGPVDKIELRADTKAIWTFADHSSITAVGPAVVHLARFKDGSSMFFVSVAASITNGTIRYDGAVGIKTALGGTYLEPGAPFGPGTEFPGKTIETFRVINKRQLVVEDL